ncbi:MAG: LEA type 2 family protein [Desulfovibrionales bacterium]|nr:LEA type 2 family protein [Desulfovibrionales bacterium]
MRKIMIMLAACVLFAGCAHLGKPVESPTVHLVNVTPASSTLFEQRVRLTLRVVNPNQFSLSWSGCKVSARFNDQDLLSGVSTKSGKVEGLGETNFTVEASASTFDVLRQILNFQQAQQKLSYQLDGALYLSGVGAEAVPFSTTGTLWDSRVIK